MTTAQQVHDLMMENERLVREIVYIKRQYRRCRTAEPLWFWEEELPAGLVLHWGWYIRNDKQGRYVRAGVVGTVGGGARKV
jgi:hypothetical protein